MTEDELERARWRFAFKVRPEQRPGVKDECLVWTGWVNNERHGQFKLEGRSATCAHRIAVFLFGPRRFATLKDMPAQRHTCWQPDCVKLEHLVDSTPAETGKALWADRRMTAEKNKGGKTVYSDTQVITLRRLRAQGWSLSRAADAVGIEYEYAQELSTGQARPRTGGPKFRRRRLRDEWPKIEVRLRKLLRRMEHGPAVRKVAEEWRCNVSHIYRLIRESRGIFRDYRRPKPQRKPVALSEQELEP